MRKYVLIDMDGTIQDASHRLHFIEKRQWDAFHGACINDPVIDTGREIYEAALQAGYKIIFMTGRNEKFKEQTDLWLWQNRFYGYHEDIMMRNDDDRRPNEELKKEWLQLLGIENVAYGVDDNVKVVNMFHQLGVPCMYMPPSAQSNLFEEKK